MRLPTASAIAFFSLAPAVYAAQSEGCTALLQAGADATSGRIRMEDSIIKQPISVRNLTCLGDLFGNGLNILTSLTDPSALLGNLANQFCAAVRDAWNAEISSVTSCGLTVTGLNFGLGNLGGGNFCGTLTIGGGGAPLTTLGIGGGTYIPSYQQRPTGY